MILRKLSGFAAVIAVFAASLWAAPALWFRLPLPDIARLIVTLAWLVLAGLAIWRIATRRYAAPFAALWCASFVALMIWWYQISPRQDRDWAPEVAHIVSGQVDGDRLMLTNIRDFTWRSTRDYDQNWIEGSFDLDRLTGVDAILSTWGMDAIAHLLVSFGFSDGQRLVFSVEIRKERDENFSNIAGFFKEYELAVIAATEADIVQLRTSVRREDVFLYPLDVTPEQARAMLLNYVEIGNDLQDRPRFYHTIAANCTTVVFGAARDLWPDLPLDWRLVLSGHVPDYLADLGLLAWDPLPADLRARAAISHKGQQATAEFSQAIRSDG